MLSPFKVAVVPEDTASTHQLMVSLWESHDLIVSHMSVTCLALSHMSVT